MDQKSSDAGGAAGPARPQGAPRWVKGLGVVGAVLLLLFVVLHLAGLTPDHHIGNPTGHAADKAGAKAVRP